MACRSMLLACVAASVLPAVATAAPPTVPPTPITLGATAGATVAGVPVGATDADGDPLAYQVVPDWQGTQGTVLPAPNGTFSYQAPAAPARAFDRFSIRVDDGKGGVRFRPVVVLIGTTRTGGSGADVLTGGPGGDVIRGGGGNDRLTGDPASGGLRRVSVSAAGVEALGGTSRWPVFSPDGTRLAFVSRALNIATRPDGFPYVDENSDDDVLLADLLSGRIDIVSTAPSGAAAGGDSRAPAFSPDGRRIAFQSTAEDLGPNDNNKATDIFVRDLAAGVTTRVSTAADGSEVGFASTRSTDPAFSPDGTAIAFVSNSDELVANDDTTEDVFLKTMQADNPSIGPVVKVSANALGDGGSEPASNPAFLPDGSGIAFDTASALVPGDGDEEEDIYLKRLADGALILVSATVTGVPAGEGASTQPVFSPAGGRLAFSSASDTLLPGDGNDRSDVYVKTLDPADPAKGPLVRASSNRVGAGGYADTGAVAAFSPDGGQVLFESEAFDLVLGPNGLLTPDLNARTDVFRRDLATGAVTRVSRGVGGAEATGDSFDPAWSPDGGRIAFASAAGNLIGADATGKPLDSNGETDLFVLDLVPRGGADRLDGGPGADVMAGGPGDDVYVVESAADRVVEAPGQGLDRVESAVAYTLPAEVEDLTLTGGRAVAGTGNGLANRITGNAAANALSGGGGADAIRGLGGKDRLTGGPGADVFVYGARGESTPAAPDTIVGFSAGQGDRIDLSAFDANARSGGRQAFVFIGGKGFPKTPGRLRFSKGVLEGDVNGDRKADFRILLPKVGSLRASALKL